MAVKVEGCVKVCLSVEMGFHEQAVRDPRVNVLRATLPRPSPMCYNRVCVSYEDWHESLSAEFQKCALTGHLVQSK